MIQERLQSTIQHYRSQLAAHESKSERAIDGAFADTMRTIHPALDQFAGQMADAMKGGEKIPLWWLLAGGRLESLKQFIRDRIDGFGKFVRSLIEQVQHFASTLGQSGAVDMLKATTDPHHSFDVPPMQNVSPLASLFDGFGTDAAQNMQRMLMIGLLLGTNPREVARNMRQSLAASRNRALTISRTEMLRAYRDASIETYRANRGVCHRWRWTALLSPNTCAMCLAMDGQEFDASVAFESHVNCRCMPVPVVRSWSGTPLLSASEWFNGLSETTQRQILGPAKFAAYQDKTITLKDLVGTAQSSVWGGSRYEKSLKEAIGIKQAAKYYGNREKAG